MDTLLLVLAVLVMLGGLAGVVIPVLPGLPLVWLPGVAMILWVRTDLVGWTVAGLLTVLLAIGTAATIWLPTRRGRRGGAPLSSLLTALAGALVGFVVIPVLGLLVGAVAGFLYAEYQRLGDREAALRSALDVLRAYGLGVLVELSVGVVMVLLWATTLVLSWPPAS